MSVVIRWATHGYVTKRSPNYKPYASTKNDPDVKVWTTRARAQAWLSRKDSNYAAACIVEDK
jgi:hypothetical protein